MRSRPAEEERRARAVVRRLGERYGTRAQTAIRFALANPDIACVLVGMAELAHLEEALAAAAMGPLPDEALASCARSTRAGSPTPRDGGAPHPSSRPQASRSRSGPCMGRSRCLSG